MLADWTIYYPIWAAIALSGHFVHSLPCVAFVPCWLIGPCKPSGTRDQTKPRFGCRSRTAAPYGLEPST